MIDQLSQATQKLLALAARSPEQIERTKLLYLGIAYAAVWIAISAYLFSLSRRQRSLEDRLKRLEADKPLEENSPGPKPSAE